MKIFIIPIFCILFITQSHATIAIVTGLDGEPSGGSTIQIDDIITYTVNYVPNNFDNTVGNTYSINGPTQGEVNFQIFANSTVLSYTLTFDTIRLDTLRNRISFEFDDVTDGVLSDGSFGPNGSIEDHFFIIEYSQDVFSDGLPEELPNENLIERGWTFLDTGTIIFAPVPEPTSLFMLFLSSAYFFRRKRN